MILPYEMSRPNPVRLEFGWEKHYRDAENVPPLQGEEPVDRDGDAKKTFPLPLIRHRHAPVPRSDLESESDRFQMINILQR